MGKSYAEKNKALPGNHISDRICVRCVHTDRIYHAACHQGYAKGTICLDSGLDRKSVV